MQGLDGLLAFLNIEDLQAVGCTAVLFADDDILRDVNQTAGQVTGVRCTQSGICQALSGATGGNEVFQNVQAFTVVCTNRDLDRLTGGVCNQAAHARELTDLAHGTTSAGIRHHENRVVAVQALLQGVGYIVGRLFPSLQYGVVTLAVGKQTVLKLIGDQVDLLFRLGDDLLFLRRDRCIADSNCDGALGGIFISLRLHRVQHFRGLRNAVYLDAFINNLSQLLLANQEFNFKLKAVLRIGAVHKAEVLWDRAVKDHASHRGIHQAGNHLAVDLHGAADLDLRVQADDMRIICHNRLVEVAEDFAFARLAVLFQGEVIGTQDHVLRRNRHRTSVGRLEQVASRQHQEAGLRLRFGGQRNVHSHLVAVEVRVIRRTCQRMELQGAAFHQDRFERLDAQSMQRRRTVEQHRVVLDDDFQRIPHLWLRALDRLSCRLDVASGAGFHQALHHKGLEQLQRHLLRQAALVHLQFRPNHDNRTAGVVHALAQQVLAETSLLALQHVGEGLQRAVVRARHRTAAAAVVDQSVNRLLQHALFVADNDIRRTEFQQALQAVVAVDNTAIEVVQVGGGKAAAVELDHRADVRRNNRYHVEDHPLRAVAGETERLHNLQALQNAHTLLAGSRRQFVLEFCGLLLQVDLFQQGLDRLRAHAGLEVILILFPQIAVLFLRQELLLLQFPDIAGICDDIQGKVEHLFQHTGGYIQNQTHTGGDSFKVPDVRYGRCQLNVAHTLAADLGPRDFHAAAVADLALIADALVLSAMALPVLLRSKNAFAEEAVALRL